MEDDAQKILALKMAYADIILNTAKEAADRIMASERKAIGFQRDLLSAKDEALRMLLRLKHMIDSKTKEAELASSCKRKKIEELESQLHEAEDMIIDLRMELKQTWDQREKGKKNQLQTLGETVENTASNGNLIPDSVPSDSLSLGPETTTGYSQRIPVDQDRRWLYTSIVKLSDSLSENNYAHPDTASLILRSKGPEHHRNGCAQRILDFEGKLLDDDLPSSENVDNQHVSLKNDLREEEICSIPSSQPRKIAMVKDVKFQTLTGRKSLFSKSRADPCRARCGQFLKSSHRSSALTSCRSYLVNCKVRSNESGQNDSLRSSILLPAKPCQPYLADSGSRSSHDHADITETEYRLKMLPRLDPGVTLIKSNVDPTSGSTSVTVSLKAINGSRYVLNDAKEDKESENRPPVEQNNVEMVRENKEAEVVNVSTSQEENNKVLKYTKRRREKKSMSPSEENTPLPKRAVKRSVNKHGLLSETEKTCLIIEQSRDSRRLAQVARQLISLSGKRWL